MPNLKADLNLLKKELGLSEEQLKEILFNYGLEIEDINLEENYIEVDITPNRLVLFSTYSLIEFLKYFLEKDSPKFPLIKDSNLKVFIDEKNKRKTLSFILKNINLDEKKLEEAIEFQEKIHISLFRKRKKAAIGIYDLDKINGNIFFKTLEPDKIKFVPLKEEREVIGKELLNTEKGREYGYLLKKYGDYWPVFLDEKGNILSVPPIINSDDIGNVNENTKNVWIEISGDNLDYLIDHLPFLIKTFNSILGGEIYSVEHYFGDKVIKTKDLIKKIEISPKDINWENYLNINLNWEDVKRALRRVGYIVENNKLFKPWYRYDLFGEQDYIEDLIIGLGINNLKDELPNLFTIGEMSEYESKIKLLKELMIGLGFLEQIGEILTHNKKLKKLGFKQNIEIINAEDENLNTLRNSLLVSFLDLLSNNTFNTYPQKIFEIGEVFNEKTQLHLGFVWSENKITFNEARQIIDYLFSVLDINYELKESDLDRYLKGRQAFIYVNGVKIGEIGEINPEILLEWKIEMPTIFGELYLDKFLKNEN